MTGNKPIALFDEPGLGKSKMVIAALVEDINAGFIESALVVCKKTLIRTWEKEVDTHCHLRYQRLSGNYDERRRFCTTFSHFYIINYESFVQEIEIISDLLKLREFAIVLDESHKIKNPEAQVTKAILSVRHLSKKNIIITGTPVANKPEDLWTQFYFLDGGSLLGKSYSRFKEKYGIEIGMGKNTIDMENLLQLQKRITNFAIRRTKSTANLDLPPKNFFEEYVFLNGKQKELYDKLREELFVEIRNSEGNQIIDQSDNILKKLLRLTQIASNPGLIDEDYIETPAKFECLDKLIQEKIKRKEKVIIWSSFVKNIIILKRRYKEHNSLTLYGKMKISDRDKVIEWFQNDDDYKVLIANPAAAKEGLTLTAANNAIYLDRSFSVVDYLQSQDRIHRISQSKECNIYKIIARNTVDEYIDELVMKKQEIARFIQGDTNDIIYPKELLTKEKLIEILGEKK